MSLPTVSVIFLSYRQEAYVEAALRSVLDQDLGDYEVIIGDDDSPDRTRMLIEGLVAAHRGRARVTLMPPEPNLGVIRNFNRCAAAAAGEILVVAAGDDVSHPGRLRRVAEFFADHPGCLAHYGNARIIDGSGAVIRRLWDSSRHPRIFRFDPGSPDLYQGVRFCGATASYRRRLFEAFGPMNDVRGGEDGPLLLRAIMIGDAAVDPVVGVDWRWHGANMSHGGRSKGLGWRATLLRCAAWPGGQMAHLPGYLADLRLAADRRLADPALLARLERLAREHHALAALRRACAHPDLGWGIIGEAVGDFWAASPRSTGTKARVVAKALSKRLLPGPLRALVLGKASNF